MASMAWRRGRHVGLLLVTSFLLITFGISDFVEVYSQAWFRPWWLLLWKATNVIGLATLYVVYQRRREDAPVVRDEDAAEA